MKTLLLLALSYLVVLAPLARAEERDEAKAAKSRPKAAQTSPHVAPRVTPQHVRPAQTTVPKVPHINQTKVPANQSHPQGPYQARAYTSTKTRDTFLPKPSTPVQPNPQVRNQDWQNRTNPNTTTRNRNWQNHHSNPVWSNNSWEEARRRHHRQHHHRDWWRSHFTRFAIFGAGYYFWDSGYWYPAYGYDPAYNTYAYDEPIYGYGDLEPAQVIANVQTELQRLGYYPYAVDGWMGPMTRAAIADYQRDNGLAITSAIDEPTLQSLGLE